MIRSKLQAWFTQHSRTLPWRSEPSPYAVLVSEFMLQQTQVATVVPYFQRWMATFPTLESLAHASEEDVLLLWQGLGYYSRARNLQRAASQILARFEGRIPSDPALLRTLPGVGDYTAGAIASFAFDVPANAIDANIARVLARMADLQLPIDSPAGKKALARFSQSLLPEKSGGRIHTSSLMELGALLCLPQNPACSQCPVSRHCHARTPETLPLKSPRKKTVRLEEHALWCLDEGHLLLERETGRRAKGMWRLPHLAHPPNCAPLYETTYPFTHHRITLRVFEVSSLENIEVSLGRPEQGGNPSGESPLRWFESGEVLKTAALPAPHRRALETLLSRKP